MTGEFVKKLRLKQEQAILLLNAPEGVEGLIETEDGIEAETSVKKPGAYDVVFLFASNQAELADWNMLGIQALKKDGIFWIAYPKISSGIGTDLTRDIGWEAVNKQNWNPVSIISIDEVWSALRFRKTEVKKIDMRTRSAKMEQTKAGRIVTKRVQVPIDMLNALEAAPDALKIFEGFAYSHRKEYVGWVADAKKTETRLKRIQKAVEMIKQGKKFS